MKKIKKINSLTFLGILFSVIFMIVILVFTFSSLSKYNRSVELLLYADRYDSAINNEITGVWRFLAGDKEGIEDNAQAYEDLKQIRLELVSKDGKRMDRLKALGEHERSLELESFFHGEDGFFSSVDEARDGFINKNNKHVRRMSGYIENWALKDSRNEKKALEVLDGIRKERILFEEFDPRSSEVDENMRDFRQTNNEVVADVILLWQWELEEAMEKTSSAEVDLKLATLKDLVGKITATSFPIISEKEALILGLTSSSEVMYGEDADSATSDLSESCEETFKEYEEEGILLWERANVTDVGEDVTPTLTLAKVVSCQQGLRVNAENLFRLETEFVNQIEPDLTLTQSNLRKLKDEISDNLKNITLTIQFLVVLMSAFFIFSFSLLVRKLYMKGLENEKTK